MRMKLSQKGLRAPAPVLKGALQTLSETIQAWSGIDASTHWHFSRNGQVDGADFYRDGEELGHLHLEGDLHLITSPSIAAGLIGAGHARRVPWGGSDDWVTYHIQGEDGIGHAEWLLKIGYDYLGGTPEPELLRRAATTLTSEKARLMVQDWLP